MNGEPDLYIGGQWRHASDGGTRDIINPADGSVAAVVDEATPDDARDAVAAARAAFDDGAWPATPVGRARRAAATGSPTCSQRDKEDLARSRRWDTGKTLVESRIDIDDVTSVFRYYAQLVGGRVRPAGRRRRPRGDQPGGARTDRGVRADRAVELPAAADVVEDRARAGRRLHDGRQAQRGHAADARSRSSHLLEEAGVPAGVVNLVQGSGAVLGAALTDTRDVDFISFTGGLATGHDHRARSPPSTSPRSPWNSAARTRTSSSPTPDWRRASRRPGAHRGVPALRAGVLGGHPADRRGVDRRRLRRRTGRAGREDPDGRRHGSRPARPARWSPSSTAPRWKPMWQLGISEGAKLVTGGARPTDPALADGQLLPAHDLRPLRPVDADRPGGDLRADPHGRAIHHRGRGDRASATTRNTVSRRAFGRPIRRGANVWCARCGTARCGSTTSATTPRRRSGADSESRATVASSAPPGSRNTKRSNTSGTTPRRTPAGWFKG